ncbi:MAG: hypothetical protein AAFY59_18985, partial [Pseudomonadota bacterium]
PDRPFLDASLIVITLLTVVAAVAVGASRGWGRVVVLTGESLGFIAVLLPKLGAGVFVASALPLLIPRERIVALVGPESGLRGLFFAALAGALVPGGPMMTFPLAAGFLAAGADLAAAIACVTAWSLYGVNRTIIWELSFLQAPLVGLRVLLCLPLPILVGLAVRRFWR